VKIERTLDCDKVENLSNKDVWRGQMSGVIGNAPEANGFAARDRPSSQTTAKTSTIAQCSHFPDSETHIVLNLAALYAAPELNIVSTTLFMTIAEHGRLLAANQVITYGRRASPKSWNRLYILRFQ
jgi:activator of HSP90 ATPase